MFYYVPCLACHALPCFAIELTSHFSSSLRATICPSWIFLVYFSPPPLHRLVRPRGVGNERRALSPRGHGVVGHAMRRLNKGRVLVVSAGTLLPNLPTCPCFLRLHQALPWCPCHHLLACSFSTNPITNPIYDVHMCIYIFFLFVGCEPLVISILCFSYILFI